MARNGKLEDVTGENLSYLEYTELMVVAKAEMP